MFVRKRFAKAVDSTIAQVLKTVMDIERRCAQGIAGAFDQIARVTERFNALEEELATNGVVRDLRKAQKNIKNLEEQLSVVVEELNSMQTNGVATAINKLNREVFKPKKQDDSEHGFYSSFARLMNQDVPEVPTLAGKVEAIVSHLGLNLEIQEPKPSKVVARKKGKK